MMKKIEVNSCNSCPYKKTGGGFGGVAYKPYCSKAGNKEIPWKPSVGVIVSSAMLTAQIKEAFPSWCPLKSERKKDLPRLSEPLQEYYRDLSELPFPEGTLIKINTRILDLAPQLDAEDWFVVAKNEAATIHLGLVSDVFDCFSSLGERQDGSFLDYGYGCWLDAAAVKKEGVIVDVITVDEILKMTRNMR